MYVAVYEHCNENYNSTLLIVEPITLQVPDFEYLRLGSQRTLDCRLGWFEGLITVV